MVAALEDADVRVVFGLPGVHNLALWRALGASPVRLVGVRHEQTAAYAADGYARAGGRVGVALTTTGPGAANTLGALGEAWASRQPVVVIATDIPTRLRRPGVWRGVLHEATDQAAMFEPVTKETLRVRSAVEIAPTIERALASATAAPQRPVYVEIPTDLLDEPVPDPPEAGTAASSPPRLPAEQLARAVEIVEGSRRPLIWAGGGALQSGAGEAIGRLSERLVAPVVLTYSASGLLAPGHPCLVEAPPHVPEAGALWDEADVVLGIGTDFDGMMTQGWKQPQPPRLVSVNVDAADASKNYLPDVLLEADARFGAEQLERRIERRGGLDSLASRVRDLNRAVREGLARSDPDALAFLDAMERVLPDDAVVVCDMCIPGYWLGGFARTPLPAQALLSAGLGHARLCLSPGPRGGAGRGRPGGQHLR